MRDVPDRSADRRKAVTEALYNNEKRSGGTELFHMQADNAVFYGVGDNRGNVTENEQYSFACTVGDADNNDRISDAGIRRQKQLAAHKSGLKVELFVYSAKNF